MSFRYELWPRMVVLIVNVRPKRTCGLFMFSHIYLLINKCILAAFLIMQWSYVFFLRVPRVCCYYLVTISSLFKHQFSYSVVYLVMRLFQLAAEDEQVSRTFGLYIGIEISNKHGRKNNIVVYVICI